MVIVYAIKIEKLHCSKIMILISMLKDMRNVNIARNYVPHFADDNGTFISCKIFEIKKLLQHSFNPLENSPCLNTRLTFMFIM